MAKARYRVALQSPYSRRADASEASAKEVEMQRPAEMDIVRRAYELWEQAESLMAEIRNSIIRQNGN